MAPAPPSRTRWNIVLAGIEAGILGGILMLAWMALVSAAHGRSIWYVPNLLATTFYGDDAMRRGFRWMTASGIALHLLLTGGVGILFSIAVSRLTSRRRVMLAGVAGALAWYYLGYWFFWRAINGLVLLYTPESGMLMAHVGLGICLGLAPRFRRHLEEIGAPAPVAAPEPDAPIVAKTRPERVPGELDAHCPSAAPPAPEVPASSPESDRG
jgi:hypothetical protein